MTMLNADFRIALKVALIDHKVLRVGYRGKGYFDPVTRDIEVYSFDERYIDAYCRLRQDPRCFRIDRIVDVKVLAETFSVDPAIESICAAQGWANRTSAWRKERMASLRLDEKSDEALFDRTFVVPEARPRAGCLGSLLVAFGWAGGISQT